MRFRKKKLVHILRNIVEFIQLCVPLLAMLKPAQLAELDRQIGDMFGAEGVDKAEALLAMANVYGMRAAERDETSALAMLQLAAAMRRRAEALSTEYEVRPNNPSLRLGQLSGGTNMVVVEGDQVGQIVMRGAGAGSMPKAASTSVSSPSLW